MVSAASFILVARRWQLLSVIKDGRLSSALGGASSPSERAEMRFNWIGGKDIKSGLFVASFPGLMGESNSVGRIPH
jgi:hypothetical protein